MARRNAYYDGITPRSLARSQGYASGPPIYSMYKPEAEAALTQAIAGRQQRFDATTQGLSQELARMGDIETYNRDELEGRMGTFTNKVNKLVQDKYGGDYSAAASELAIMVGQERGDPFYAFNKQKVEATKNIQQDERRIGAGFLSSGDPRDVSFKDWQEGATFDYVPINSKDITAASANAFKHMANAVRETGVWKETAGRRLLERIDQRGFATPEEIDEFLEIKEGQMMVEELKASMPELANIKNQQAVDDAIRLGAYSGIGRTERQTIRNPGFVASDDNGGGGGGRAIIPKDVAGIELSNFEGPPWKPQADAMARIIGDAAGIKIKSFKELDNISNKRKDTRFIKNQLLPAALTAINPILGPAAFIPSVISDTPIGTLIDWYIDKKYGKDTPEVDFNIKKTFNKAMEIEFGTSNKKIQTYEVNNIIDPKNLATAEKWVKALNTTVSGSLFKFVEGELGLNKESNKALKNFKGDVSLYDFNLLDGSGLLLGLTGENNDGKQIQARIVVEDPYFVTKMMSFIGQLNVAFWDRFYGTEEGNFKDGFLGQIYEGNPELYPEYLKALEIQQYGN